MENNIKTLEELLKKPLKNNEDILQINLISNSYINKYYELLEIACINGYENVFCHLIMKDNIVFKIKDDLNLFIKACINGNINIIKTMIKLGIGHDTEEILGHSIINFTNNVEVAKLLINNGYTINKRMLDQIKNESILQIIKNHLDFFEVCASNTSDKIIDFLNNNDICVNAKNEDGKCAIVYAMINRQYKLIELLFNRGIDVNTINIDGHTGIQFACYKNDINMIKLLIECGANIDTDLFKYCKKEESWNLIKDYLEDMELIQESIKNINKQKNEYNIDAINIIACLSLESKFEIIKKLSVETLCEMANNPKNKNNKDVINALCLVAKNSKNQEIYELVLNTLFEISKDYKNENGKKAIYEIGYLCSNLKVYEIDKLYIEKLCETAKDLQSENSKTALNSLSYIVENLNNQSICESIIDTIYKIAKNPENKNNETAINVLRNIAINSKNQKTCELIVNKFRDMLNEPENKNMEKIIDNLCCIALYSKNQTTREFATKMFNKTRNESQKFNQEQFNERLCKALYDASFLFEENMLIGK